MSTQGLRRWALRTATFATAALALLTTAAPAWAHSELERSDPPQGGMVAPGRSTIRLWFEEPVNPRASAFELSGAEGRRVAVAITLSQDSRAVSLKTDPLRIGSYQLSWRAFSLTDGHSASGSLVFGAGLRPTVLPDAGAGLPPVGVLLLRWLALSTILGAIGALVVSLRVLGELGEAGVRPRHQARSIALFAAAASAYAALVTPFVRTYRSGTPFGAWVAETWGILMDTPLGHVWLARGATTVIAAALVWSWVRQDRSSTRLARLALVGLVLSAVLEAMAGHASTLPRLSSVAILMSAAHIVAAGVWAGGLVVLAVCLVPLMRRRPDLRGVVLTSVWRNFSPMAAVASLVLVATGLYEAGRHVPSIGSLAAGAYGVAVTGKTILLGVALVVAGLNLLIVNPRAAARVARALRRPTTWTPVARHRFTTLVVVEAVVLVAAVGLAAVLTTTPTAREVARANQVTEPQTESVDGLFITIEDIGSGAPRSRLVVRVRPTVLPALAPVTGVDVELSGPAGASDSIRLARVDEGRFEAERGSSAPGAWSATLRIHRRGLPDTVAQPTWTVASPSGVKPTRLEVVSTALAAVLLLGLLILLAQMRRRRRYVSPPVAAAPQPEREVSLR